VGGRQGIHIIKLTIGSFFAVEIATIPGCNAGLIIGRGIVYRAIPATGDFVWLADLIKATGTIRQAGLLALFLYWRWLLWNLLLAATDKKTG
jgi:hypothetical protein